MRKIIPIPHRLIFSISFLFFAFCGYAQKIPVTIKVVNDKNIAIANATVAVKVVKDSSVQFNNITDSSGQTIFSLEPGTLYQFKISSINYVPAEKSIVVQQGQSIISIILEAVSGTLKNVTVTSQRPLMRQEDDKTIVDPEVLAAASTNAYEIIEKVPGIFVDQDGNIYSSSLTPSSIQINGRDMKMSAADVATLLKNLPPNSIAKIEIVRSPSARYDASGTGGIINIVLRKGVKPGMTGSVNTGWQQGVYNNKFAGINLNNDNGKQSFYLNLNYNRRNSFEDIQTDRLFSTDTILKQSARTVYPGDSYYGSFGITWQLNKKWDLTYDINLSYSDSRNRSNNSNIIQKISTSQILSNSLNNVLNKGNTFFAGTGIELKNKIDTAGSEWVTNLYYSRSKNNSDQDFITQYFSPSLTPNGGDGTAENNRNYLNARSDLKLKMKNRFTFETGWQSSFNTYRNATDYFRESNGIRQKDNSRTNTFRYKENINAAYLQGTQTFGKDFVVKFGTRVENTNMVGRQIIPGDTSFAIHRTDLFPYIYLSKPIMSIAGYELRAYLVYRRTISRPSYDQLNPFSRYVDQYLTEVGNPGLRPQFTQNYEANISVDERPIFAMGVNDTKDIFTNVVYQADSTRSQAYRTFDNVGKNKEFYFRALGALPPGKKFFFVAGAQYNHNFYNGLYENKPLAFKRGTWTFFTHQSLKFDSRSQLSLTGFIRLNGQQQFYELGTFGNLNLSINRQFLNRKLIVTVSINDLFYSNKNDFTINQGSVNAAGTRRADTRRVGINIRYNFGIRKKEDKSNMFDVAPEM